MWCCVSCDHSITIEINDPILRVLLHHKLIASRSRVHCPSDADSGMTGIACVLPGKNVCLFDVMDSVEVCFVPLLPHTANRP